MFSDSETDFTDDFGIDEETFPEFPPSPKTEMNSPSYILPPPLPEQQKCWAKEYVFTKKDLEKIQQYRGRAMITKIYENSNHSSIPSQEDILQIATIYSCSMVDALRKYTGFRSKSQSKTQCRTARICAFASK